MNSSGLGHDQASLNHHQNFQQATNFTQEKKNVVNYRVVGELNLDRTKILGWLDSSMKETDNTNWTQL